MFGALCFVSEKQESSNPCPLLPGKKKEGREGRPGGWEETDDDKEHQTGAERWSTRPHLFRNTLCMS